MSLLNKGFWPSQFFQPGFWHEDFWQDWGILTITVTKIYGALRIFNLDTLDRIFKKDTSDHIFTITDDIKEYHMK